MEADLWVRSLRSSTPRTTAGAQPLHLAASRGHAAVAKYLLKKGRPADLADSYRKFAFI